MNIEKALKIVTQLWPIYLFALIVFIGLIVFAVVMFIKGHQADCENEQRERRIDGFIISCLACGVLVLCIIFTCVINSCPDCGRLFTNDQKYCYDCGKQLSYVCSCGKTNLFYTVHCPECGVRVNGG